MPEIAECSDFRAIQPNFEETGRTGRRNAISCEFSPEISLQSENPGCSSEKEFASNVGQLSFDIRNLQLRAKFVENSELQLPDFDFDMEKYERIKLLGRGAHGAVYLCKRLFDNKFVVVKEIPVEMKTADERLAALGEVKLLDLLDHPNIIGYNENFFDENHLCIVMEYAEGGTLADYIGERRGSLMVEGQILRFFTQLCNSLYYLHSKNILHRDIKPQNILLDKTRAICKLSDFGISKILSTITKASTVIGTPSYLSPEICEGKAYNKKSDIWSLGCILYELMTLRKAFEAETLGCLVMQITRGQIKPVDNQYSARLKQLLLRLLTVDPISRPSIEEIRADPLIALHLFDHIDIGAIRCPRPFKSSRTIKLRSSNRSRRQHLVNQTENLSVTSARPKNKCKIFAWGKGFDGIAELPLPANKMVIQMACSPSFKMGVTKENEQKAESREENFGLWYCETMKLSSPVQITHVACSELFYALITDRGILMTCGSGANGCLAHGLGCISPKPRIVEALVKYEVTKVACSAFHVLAVTSENELFGWGQMDEGRLGLPGKGVLGKPTKIPLLDGISIHSIHCTADSSAILTAEGDLYCTGVNNFNKLALCSAEKKEVKGVSAFTKANIGPRKIDVKFKQPFSLSTNHSAFISDCHLYTYGSNCNEQLGPRLPSCSNNFPSEVLTTNLTRVNAVVCDDGHCIMRTEDHRLYSWGSLKDSRLGRLGCGKEIGLISVDNLSYDSVLAIASSDGCTMVSLKS